jgi:hypothetical protein
MSEDSVLFLSGLLHDEQVRRGTRKNTRTLSTFRQAVLVLRWFLDDTRMTALARDNGINLSTASDVRPAVSANAPTPYSRPPTRSCAATAAAPGASARSSPQHWSWLHTEKNRTT